MMINPIQQLELTSLSNTLREQGIVRISNFLEKESLDKLSNQSVTANYKHAFFISNSAREVADSEMAALDSVTQQNIFKDIYQNAAQGIGYWYGRNKLNKSGESEADLFLNSLNSESFISLMRQITGNEDISYADGQQTRFSPGTFLTRHIDNVQGETRLYAYVLGLSPNWHPDWGGLLQFFEPSGEPTSSLCPTFNTFTIFDVNMIHSVTAVANFSPANRYSITGWFRA